MSGSDVVVIGGGIAGVGCAAMLAEYATVTLLEAETSLGHHSTSRSAAVWIPSYGGPQVRALTAASESYLDTPPEELGAATLLRPRGQLLIANADEAPRVDALLAEAPEVAEISPREALSRVPILNAEQVVRACVEERTRDIDVDLLLQSWTRLLRRRGGRVVTGAAVRALERCAGGWQVCTADQRHAADLVINAAGAWADEIAAMAGLGGLGLVPNRRCAALLPAPGGHDVDRWPLFGSVAENWYAKPMAGKLMVSPADEDPTTPHDAYVDDLVLAAGLHRYEQAVTCPVTRVEHRWAGLRTFAPDRVPVLGIDPRAEGFFWCAGQGGYGVQTAPAMARLAAELAASRPPPFAPTLVSALDPARLMAA